MLPRLRVIRQSKLMSQRDLAAASGVALSTINRLEHGQQLARYVTVRKLAEALKVDPHEILGATGQGTLRSQLGERRDG